MLNTAVGANRDTATPFVSIIVPTRNRVNKLARCLEYVGAIRSGTPWETIVVDNGSTDETSRFLEAFAHEPPMPFRAVREPAAGGMRSRNAGAECSRGEVLIFIDNDCYPASDIVDQYAAIFRDPAIGFAGGRILPYERATDESAERTLALMESEIEIQYPAGQPVPCGILQGGNMAVRRRALMAVGGFDERMGPGTRFPAEDWEVLTRIGAAGWSGGYFPGPMVAHDHPRSATEAQSRLKSYHVGMGAVYLKLVADPRTRPIYLQHIVRRFLGDMKFHQMKVATQIYGGLLFLRQNRRHLLDAAPGYGQRP
jgi:cellulose synthase/poly-beta-1,6-N-acetylglucosamine synthase-like glycosyltransferase